MSKYKILLVNDSTSLNTGYSVYGKEILTRLYSTNQFEIAEMSSYTDKVDETVPWKIYPAVPANMSDEQLSVFLSDQENVFGKYVFENVLLDFKPNTVISFRDPWMDSFISDSPLREYYNWVYMPPVDGIGQTKEWISLYSCADAILTYSIWAKKLLSNYPEINVIDIASPSADDCFVPFDNPKELKLELGLPEDSFVIGSVMRNQKRKLFPDLVFAFNRLLSLLPIEIASKTYLYLHTSYPDLGWNIPRMLIESGVSNRIFFTYLCEECNYFFPSVWKGNCIYCLNCKNQSCFTAGTKNGISNESMVKIYNGFDCLVQYSICEGFGMPQVEAAYCGVPVFCVNYSAMQDMPETILATPINYSLSVESETHRGIANPDKIDLANKLKDLILLPEFLRSRKRFEIASTARDNYSYNKSANVWINTISKLKPAKNWNSPKINIVAKNFNYSKLEDNEFIDAAFENILSVKSKKIEKVKFDFKRKLFNKFEKNRMKTDRESIIAFLNKLRESINHWEEMRVSK